MESALLSFRSPRIARALTLKGFVAGCPQIPHNQPSDYRRIYRADPRSKDTEQRQADAQIQRRHQQVWTDANNERKENTQWHQVIVSDGFSKLAACLASGSHFLVQGEIVTREYERVFKVPNGKKTIEHKIQQHVVEIKATIIRVLDRSASGESDAAEQNSDESGAEPQ